MLSEPASDDVMREASPDNDEYVVICSQRVTKRCNLLRLLESRAVLINSNAFSAVPPSWGLAALAWIQTIRIVDT